MDALRRARSYSSLTVAMPDPSSRASSSAAPRAGNRQTDRQGGRLQDLAPPLGDRAHILLAAPQSPPDGPLRSPRHDRRRLCQAHDDRGHAEAADGGGPLDLPCKLPIQALKAPSWKSTSPASSLLVLLGPARIFIFSGCSWSALARLYCLVLLPRVVLPGRAVMVA